MARADRQEGDRLFDPEFLRRLERLRLMAKAADRHRSPGRRRSRRLGDGLELADFRDYAPGDDVRFLDWAYYARMQRLVVRLFHEHSEAELVALVDCSGSMVPGGDRRRFDHARRAAAAMVYLALAGGDRSAVAGFAETLSGPVHLGRDRSAFPSALRHLASWSAGGETRLAEAAGRLAAGGPPGRTVLLISDLAGCEAQLGQALSALRSRRAEVTVIHVYAPEDAGPTLAGAVELRGAESDRAIRLDADESLLAAYRRAWKDRQERLGRLCASRRCVYVPAGCDQPFERLALASLARAGVVSE